MQPKSKVEHLGRRIRETLSENCESEKDLERFSYIITTKRALATMQPLVVKGSLKIRKRELSLISAAHTGKTVTSFWTCPLGRMWNKYCIALDSGK